MDMDAMNQLSYGIFVLTAHQNGRDNGSIINTAMQLTVEPNRIAITVGKGGLTHDMVLATRKFTVSILNEQVEASLIQRFGFVSGKHVNKFADFQYGKRVANGTMAITRGTNAYISAVVEQCIDLGSHTLFIALVTDATVWNHIPSATYAYYHRHIKKQFQEQAAPAQTVRPAGIPEAQETARPAEAAQAQGTARPVEAAQAQEAARPAEAAQVQGAARTVQAVQARWRCKVCGYIYDPAQGDPNHGIPAGTAFEDLPSDWVCPLCGLGKDVFERI